MFYVGLYEKFKGALYMSPSIIVREIVKTTFSALTAIPIVRGFKGGRSSVYAPDFYYV